MTTENQSCLRLASPLSGWCATLDDNPDPVFRDRILGDGVSIDPTEGKVCAPFDGEVLTVPESRHAINLRADNGAEFLIHVGVDTVGMAGDGFQAHVAPGDRVESGQLLLSFDLEKVLRGAASLKTPVLLLSDGFEIGSPKPAGAILRGDELFEVRAVEPAGEAAASPAGSGSDFKEISKAVAVGLEHGIHARPAASLKAAIADLDASVSCRMGNQAPADARSPVALMSQNISYGDVITVAARGRDAQQALEAVVSHLDPLDLDEEELAARTRTMAESPVSKEPPAPLTDGAIVRACPASPGLSMGAAFGLETWDAPAGEAPGPLAEEQQALARALDAVRSHLQKLAAEGTGAGAEIAVAHLALLEDPAITGSANDLLERGLGASRAWHDSIEQSVKTLQQVDDKRMRERIDDLKDMRMT